MTTIKTLEELERAIANNERLRYQYGTVLRDHNGVLGMSLAHIQGAIRDGALFIAPKMTFIEGKGGRFEYPKPMKNAAHGSDVWVADPTMSEGVYLRAMSLSVRNDSHLLEMGLCHSTKKAAEQHLEAYRKAMGVDDE